MVGSAVGLKVDVGCAVGDSEYNSNSVGDFVAGFGLGFFTGGRRGSDFSFSDGDEYQSS